MKIQNYDVYTSRMNKAIFDKCWWFDKIEDGVDTVVDYGCADGALFKFLNQMAPGQFTKMIGIDNNLEMRQRAVDNFPTGTFIPNLKCLVAIEDFDASRAVLVLNSVIHEILTYKGQEYFSSFLEEVNKIGFKHIAIREMHLNLYDVFGYSNYFEKKLSQISDDDIFERWIDYKDTVKVPSSNYYDMERTLCKYYIEFLFKYTYKENWEREKNETYFWEWKDVVVSSLNRYKPEIDKNFDILAQKEQIKKDFNISFPFMTHNKMLLTKIDKDEEKGS